MKRTLDTLNEMSMSIKTAMKEIQPTLVDIVLSMPKETPKVAIVTPLVDSGVLLSMRTKPNHTPL